MSNKRITDLTELTTPTTDDVFPVVDIATNTTTKVQLGNLPVPTSVTTALATKQDTLVSGTNIKTVNSTSLLGSGNVAVQETLVSGTNIKTINSTSLLGSGNITIAANPSGVAGAIQFSDGSAFASDATKFFWDDTNKRLGIGLNTPVAGPFQVKTTQSNANGSIIFTNNTTATILAATDTGSALTQLQFRASSYNFTDTAGMRIASTGYATTPTAMLQVVGSGSTSATTSLLVQNSAGTNWLQVKDDGDITNGANGSTDLKFEISPVANKFFRLTRQGVNVDFFSGSAGNAGITVSGTNNAFNVSAASANLNLSNGGVRVGSTYATTNASAQLEVVSTTKGFLPPRMTTTEKNAIATPAAGLVVYDSTTNKLCCYNGTTWNDLF